jgi:hypothetical protein
VEADVETNGLGVGRTLRLDPWGVCGRAPVLFMVSQDARGFGNSLAGPRGIIRHGHQLVNVQFHGNVGDVLVFGREECTVNVSVKTHRLRAGHIVWLDPRRCARWRQLGVVSQDARGFGNPLTEQRGIIQHEHQLGSIQLHEHVDGAMVS